MLRITSHDRDPERSGGSVQYAPAEHGGNIYQVAAQLGLPEARLIDFSASINPLGISRKVKETIRKEMDGLVNYPDPDTAVLRQKLAAYHNIDPDGILCGNGSTELIYLIPRALRPGQAIIPTPTFSEYEKACKLSNRLRVVNFVLREKNNFRMSADDFAASIESLSFDSGIAFLCNPNNPTGALLNRHEVLEIAETARKRKCFLVVDEAFIDFIPDASVIRDVSDNPYLIVLRSMTKFHALTGLRIGYAVFHRDLIGRAREYKEPWTVNSMAQKAAVTALEDTEYSEKTHRLIACEKRFIEKSLEKAGITFFPSAANFYLLKAAGAAELVVRLRGKGILVRDCSNFRGLDASFIRIAVKSRKHNQMLMKELSELCAG